MDEESLENRSVEDLADDERLHEELMAGQTAGDTNGGQS